jgi:hypothetical protein
MAEKEERIVIKKQINYHPPYGGWTGDGKEIVLTRQEAINRMAKAAKKAYRGYFYAEPHHPNVSDMMEAALNALLEERYEN